MSTLSEIRDGLAANVGTIKGLHTSAFVPDNPNPPVAIVIPTGITYDSTFARAMDEYSFSVLLLVSKVVDRASQSLLDGYCAASGDTSIKEAIEADKTLGGAAFDCRVQEMRNYQQTPVGDSTYLSAEFTVQVYAQ